MDTMTNTELAILGLIAERPRHGYQGEQDIELRGMREWTEIGFSSIYYVLNKLESAGWLASELVAGGEGEQGRGGPARRGPARRVYRITAAGAEAIRAAVTRRLAHPNPRSGDFELALANLPALSPQEVREALETHRAELQQRLEYLRAKWQSDRAALAQAGMPFPPHIDTLFSRSLVMIQAELDWVTQYLNQPEVEQ